jgi:hypothetical protein
LVQQLGMSPVSHLRLTALERALSETLPAGLVRDELLESAWNGFDAINGMIDFNHANPARTQMDIDYRLGAVMAAEQVCKELQADIVQAINTLNKRYNLTIEVVQPG